MVYRCADVSKLECPVVFEGDEDYIAEQLSAHLKGSHGIDISPDGLKALWAAPVAPKPTKEPKVKAKVKARSKTFKHSKSKKSWF